MHRGPIKAGEPLYYQRALTETLLMTANYAAHMGHRNQVQEPWAGLQKDTEAALRG